MYNYLDKASVQFCFCHGRLPWLLIGDGAIVFIFLHSLLQLDSTLVTENHTTLQPTLQTVPADSTL